MKYLSPVIFFPAILMISCNESSTKAGVTSPADTSKSAENKIMVPASTCYSSVTGKDTFRLKVEIFPNVVTGKLSYQFFEKDSNIGEFEGRLHGDTLLADYKFMSEGKLSTRQVIFLMKDGAAIEGYGDMEEKEGKMVFKNTNDITFEKGLIFKLVECGEY